MLMKRGELQRASGWIRYVTLSDADEDEKIERMRVFKEDLPLVLVNVNMVAPVVVAPAVVAMFGGV
jgi:hypothetical protein